MPTLNKIISIIIIIIRLNYYHYKIKVFVIDGHSVFYNIVFLNYIYFSISLVFQTL